MDSDEQQEQKRAAWRRWYHRNKAKESKRRQEKTRKVRAAVKEYIREYKLAHPCKCGEGHPACLDFHHKDPSAKKKAIGNMVGSTTSWACLERIKEEIEKCEVLCSNCHRKLHFGDRAQGGPPGLGPGHQVSSILTSPTNEST